MAEEDFDPINVGEIQQVQQPQIVPQVVAAQNGQNGANGPPLPNLNQSFAQPAPTKISGLIVPEKGHIVYVINEPGKANYMYEAEVIEYPAPSYDKIKVKVREFLEPQPVPPALRQREVRQEESVIDRKYIRYSQTRIPIPPEKYENYLNTLNEENPIAIGGRGRKKSHTKRKSHRKSKSTKKSKKSQKRRRA